MTGKKTSAEKIDLLKVLVDDGFSAREIAEMLDMNIVTTGKWKTALNKGYDSVGAYTNFLAQRKGFKNSTSRVLHSMKKYGFKSHADLRNHYRSNYGSDIEYERALAKRDKKTLPQVRLERLVKRGFTNFADYRKYRVEERTGGSLTDYEYSLRKARSKRPENQAFASYLRETLKTTGTEWKTLADYLDINKGTVWAYLKGSFLPSEEKIQKIFLYFNSNYLTLDNLVKDYSKKKSK